MEQTCDRHETGTDDCCKPGLAQKGKSAAAGFIWVAGLLLAGSDSPFMPGINLLGVLMFAGVIPVLGSWCACPEPPDASPRSNLQPGFQPSFDVNLVPPSRGFKTSCVSQRDVYFPGGGPGRIFSKI
jgi:hypothetical protein